MYVCLCHGVSDRRIKQLAGEGVSTMEELASHTQLGTCCGCCQDVAEVILHQSCLGGECASTGDGLPVLSVA